MSGFPLRLYPTEAAARKAGLELCDLRGEQRLTVLYALHRSGEKKPQYLLSASARLTVAERRWIAEQELTATKLGRFQPGIGFLPLQRNMVRGPSS